MRKLISVKWIVSWNAYSWNGKESPIWIASKVEVIDCALIQDAGPRAVGFDLRQVQGWAATDAPAGL